MRRVGKPDPYDLIARLARLVAGDSLVGDLRLVTVLVALGGISVVLVPPDRPSLPITLPQPSLKSRVGSLAMLLVMRRASSSVSTFAIWGVSRVVSVSPHEIPVTGTFWHLHAQRSAPFLRTSILRPSFGGERDVRN